MQLTEVIANLEKLVCDMKSGVVTLAAGDEALTLAGAGQRGDESLAEKGQGKVRPGDFLEEAQGSRWVVSPTQASSNACYQVKLMAGANGYGLFS